MAVFYQAGETEIRPGVYQRHENVGSGPGGYAAEAEAPGPISPVDHSWDCSIVCGKWVYLEVLEDGHLWVMAGNTVEEPLFSMTEDGRLEVTYS